MGEVLRQRVLRALGLGTVWVQLEALSARLRRVEFELREQRPLPEAFRQAGHTIPASPPPPAQAEKGER